MFKWLHHILNPHCEHCAEEKREAKFCVSCDILKQEVARLQIENDRLLSRLLDKPEPKEPASTDLNNMVPIMPRARGWQERKKLLEAEDRHKAQLLKQVGATGTETIEELEKELGVDNAG
jgi:hypothetical protein